MKLSTKKHQQESSSEDINLQEHLLHLLVSLRQDHSVAEGQVHSSSQADQLSPDNFLLPHSACPLELHHTYLCNHTMYIIQLMCIY